MHCLSCRPHQLQPSVSSQAISIAMLGMLSRPLMPPLGAVYKPTCGQEKTFTITCMTNPRTLVFSCLFSLLLFFFYKCILLTSFKVESTNQKRTFQMKGQYHENKYVYGWQGEAEVAMNLESQRGKIGCSRAVHKVVVTRTSRPARNHRPGSLPQEG